jgi:uncharacterized membrane protein HdeD (DUF308 family)
MASYWEYLWVRIKAVLLAIAGLFIIVLSLFGFTINEVLGAVLLLAGIGLIIYAKLKLNAWFWNREEGNHIFVKGGRFR